MRSTLLAIVALLALACGAPVPDPDDVRSYRYDLWTCGEDGTARGHMIRCATAEDDCEDMLPVYAERKDCSGCAASPTEPGFACGGGVTYRLDGTYCEGDAWACSANDEAVMRCVNGKFKRDWRCTNGWVCGRAAEIDTRLGILLECH